MRALLLLMLVTMASSLWADEHPDPRIEIPGAHNTFQVAGWLCSGSQPETEAAFAELKRRGIKTIMSVDGAKPDVAMAAKFGMRYIHLPFGYDGIPRERAVELVKVARTVDGPIYVHCHHGLHRGPAAVAVMCMAREGWTPVRAETWLREAGTAADYQGLYRAVRAYTPPTAEELAKAPADFPATAPVPPMVDAMVAIDEIFDRLKAAQKGGWKAPADHPDFDLPHEALMLSEQFRELSRGDDARKRPADYLEKLRTAEDTSAALHLRLKAFAAGDAAAFRTLDEAWTQAGQSCGACHKTYRNKK